MPNSCEMVKELYKKTFTFSAAIFIMVGIFFIVSHFILTHSFTYETASLLFISLFLLIIVLAFSCYFSYTLFVKSSKDNNTEIQNLRNKMSHLSSATNVTVMQYDVAKKLFIRWKDTGDEELRHFTVNDYYTYIHPEDLPIAMKLVEIMDGRRISHYTCEYRYMFPNSTEYSWQYNNIYDFEISKNNQVTSYIGVCQKRNRIHEMEEKIDIFRKKSSFILKLNRIYIIYYDTSTHIITLLDQSGDTPDRVISFETFWNNIYPDDFESANYFKQILDGHQVEKAHVELRYKFADQYEWLDINAAAFEIDAQNEIKSYMCLCRNNSIWKNTMNEMATLRDKAEMSNKLKTAFLANMSHEIRTPLNSILGFSNLLSEDISKEDKTEFENIIRTNTEQLLNIVDDIINLSEIESGYIDLKYKQFSIYSFVKELADMNRIHIHRNIDLICLCPADYLITTDERRVREVTYTLLKNANKFTKEGEITLAYEKREGGLYISVSDTGLGIALKDQKRIFERFEKVDSFVPGAGLGLSICKEIIKKMNGKIGVQSTIGKGSTFWFWIPCEMSEPIKIKDERLVIRGDLLRELSYSENANPSSIV